MKRSRCWFLVGIVVVIFVLVSSALMIGRESTWEDEVFAVSTGWSMVHSWPPAPSVLGQYPGTGSPIRFYGPVSFEVAAWLIRIGGLSATAWRLACFAGVVLTLWSTVGLVRLCGGNRWAQLTAALFVVFVGSSYIYLPGRWDWVSSGLFIAGLMFFLRGVESGSRVFPRGSLLAGVLIGISLASTPRVLTLCFAALISTLAFAFFFPALRKRFLLGGSVTLVTALLCQTILLLPWHMNSFSWAATVRNAGRQDRINLTPVVGQGHWAIAPQAHKGLMLAFALLLLTWIPASLARQRTGVVDQKRPLRIFLALTAFLNFALIVMLLRHPLGEGAFWVPISLAAIVCWLDSETLKADVARVPIRGLILASLLILAIQEVQTAASVLLSWNQRSRSGLTAFIQRTIPEGSVVYGPVGGYFFGVELAGDRYLYPFERTTPGLYSKTPLLTESKLDEAICAHPTYFMWPLLAPLQQAPGLPGVVLSHVDKEVGEWEQPRMPVWKRVALDHIGPIANKFGLPDMAIYSLRSPASCRAQVGPRRLSLGFRGH